MPHDLLKVVDWKRHTDRRRIRELLPKDVREGFRVICKAMDGRVEERSFEDILRGHQSTDGFWERTWAFADRLAAASARLRLEYDYWYGGQSDPFFVGVYGDIVIWDKEKREALWRRIVDVFLRYCKMNKSQRAFEEVNELLGKFPADSRFPFVSLKTHHWLTQAINVNRLFWEKCVKEGKNVVFDRLYLLRVSLPESCFHRLKELRRFRALCSKALQKVVDGLSERKPLKIGDDVYLIVLGEEEIDKVRRFLLGCGFGFDVEVFEWRVERKLTKTRFDGKAELNFLITDFNKFSFSVGAFEDWEPKLEKAAEWADILESECKFVAWIRLKPVLDAMGLVDVEKLIGEFLDWGESELFNRFGSKRIELKEKVLQKITLCPEILVSVVEGYYEFLKDCVSAVSRKVSNYGIITLSFGESLLVCGVDDFSEAFDVYCGLLDLESRLHVGGAVALSMVVSKPKYPFWRVLEVLSVGRSVLALVEGDKMVSLDKDDVSLVRSVKPSIRAAPRSQFHEIINYSRRAGIEELKLFIEGKGASSKIPFRASKALCGLIDKFARKYEGKKLKDVVYRSLKLLEPFTKKGGRG